MFRGCG